MKSLILLVCCVCFVSPVKAGGSVDTATILEVLETNKPLKEYLESTLEFENGGWAVRLGRHFEEMGGARIAPYHVLVKPKGAKEFTMELVVECSQKFTDKDGKEVDIGEGGPSDATVRAVDVEEIVTSVTLRDAKDAVE